MYINNSSKTNNSNRAYHEKTKNRKIFSRNKDEYNMINDIGNLSKSEKISTLNFECFKISELCMKQRNKIIITQWQ